MRKLAPVVLFTYNRLSETRRTIEALQKNYLANESDLYVFSDGPKSIEAAVKVQEVRDYLKTIKGFKAVSIKIAEKNKGLANSVIDGVTEIIDIYDKVIVLEDDLVSSPNFLDFMNQALEFYRLTPEVISISGYSHNLKTLVNFDKDFYINKRASSWGWGTWKDKWEGVDWQVTDYKQFRKSWRQQLNFYKVGSDMPKMLKNQMEGKIDSWAIRWCYYQFKKGMYTVFPSKSKIDGIGDGIDATHTAGVTKFKTPLDNTNKREFNFNLALKENRSLMKESKAIFSLSRRLKDKIKRTIKNINS